MEILDAQSYSKFLRKELLVKRYILNKVEENINLFNINNVEINKDMELDFYRRYLPSYGVWQRMFDSFKGNQNLKDAIFKTKKNEYFEMISKKEEVFKLYNQIFNRLNICKDVYMIDQNKVFYTSLIEFFIFYNVPADKGLEILKKVVSAYEFNDRIRINFIKEHDDVDDEIVNSLDFFHSYLDDSDILIRKYIENMLLSIDLRYNEDKKKNNLLGIREKAVFKLKHYMKDNQIIHCASDIVDFSQRLHDIEVDDDQIKYIVDLMNSRIDRKKNINNCEKISFYIENSYLDNSYNVFKNINVFLDKMPDFVKEVILKQCDNLSNMIQYVVSLENSNEIMAVEENIHQRIFEIYSLFMRYNEDKVDSNVHCLLNDDMIPCICEDIDILGEVEGLYDIIDFNGVNDKLIDMCGDIEIFEFGDFIKVTYALYKGKKIIISINSIFNLNMRNYRLKDKQLEEKIKKQILSLNDDDYRNYSETYKNVMVDLISKSKSEFVLSLKK